MTFKSLVLRINSLAPLSDVAISVHKLFANGAYEVDVKELIKTIESDAILAANILKMINSPLYGLNKNISSIAQAVTLFGVSTIYGVVLKYAINEHVEVNKTTYGVTNQKFNEMCHIQRNLFLQWYTKIDRRTTQFLAPLVLMMETGKLILEQEIDKSDYKEEFLKGLQRHETVEDYEIALFGRTSYYICALLFKHWNLEPIYVKILLGLDSEKEGYDNLREYEDILRVIRTAINVKHILSDDSIKEASTLVSKMGLKAYEFKHIAQDVQKRW